MMLAGVDFTSRPTPRKPITVAIGHLRGTEVHLDRVLLHRAFGDFSQWLQTRGPWVAAFDFPFGLPRELVVSLRWPGEWLPLMRHYASLSREEIRHTFAAFCNARPAGSKFAHRACDGPAGSSPSMKWVNPPVAYMLHAGVPLLMDAGVHLPGLHAGDPGRVALEGYPGLLARELVGRRSYKSDTKSQQTEARRAAREEMLELLDGGRTRLGLRLSLLPAQRAALVGDASGDLLDAALCLVQAAWASSRSDLGRPHDTDPLEGWIVTAPS